MFDKKLPFIVYQHQQLSVVEISNNMTWTVCSRNLKKTQDEPEEKESNSEAEKTSKSVVEISNNMTWNNYSLMYLDYFKKTPNEPEGKESNSEAKKTSKWTHGLVLGTILITVSVIATFAFMTYVIVNQNSKIQDFEGFIAKIPNFKAIITYDHTADEQLFDIAFEIGKMSWTRAILDNQSEDYKGLQLIHGLQDNDKHKVDYLLANIADGNVRRKCGPHGEFPIILAAKQNMTEMVKRFLSPRFGASPNVSNSQGESPLKFAVRNNNLEMAKTLLKFGADVNTQDNNQLLPLHFAVRRSDGVPMTRLLLEYGSKIDYRNKHGRTPLFYASKETAHLLIDYGANIEDASR